MKWYYMEGGQEKGPFDKDRMQGLVNDGAISRDTYVRNDQSLNWTTYGRLLDEAQKQSGVQPEEGDGQRPVPASGPGVCSECGHTFEASKLIEYQGSRVCQSCSPALLRRLGGSGAGLMQYAGFWVRFGAKIIDGMVLFIPLMAVNLIFIMLVPGLDFSGDYSGDFTPATLAGLGLMYFIQVAIPLAYTTFFLGRYAATPGKMALGLKVVLADGGSLTYARAFGRHFAEFLSQITLYIGYIMAGLDDQKRALHDHVAGTRVVRK